MTSNPAGDGPGRIYKLKFNQIQNQIWGELVFGSQNNTPDEINGANNAVSCYRCSTVQCFLCYVSLPVVNEICKTVRNFVFFVRVMLIKIANTPLDRSAALVLSVINCMYCNCTRIR